MIPLWKNIPKKGPPEPQISPPRYAPVEMTKGKAVFPGRVVAEQEPFSSLWVGRRPMTPLSKIKLQLPTLSGWPRSRF
jgi:hypothetical protein